MAIRGLPRTHGIALAAFIAACSTGTTAPTGDFTVVAGLAAATTLAVGDTFDVTVHSTGGFAGNVLLTFTGVPADWIVTLTQNPVVVPANGNGMSTVTVTVPSNGTPAPSGQAITVHATGLSRAHTAPATITVANEYVIPIALGTDSLLHWGALRSTAVHLNIGTTVSVLNNDTTPHLVHFGGVIPGLNHQNVSTPLAQGQKYSQVPTSTGNDSLLCHLHTHEGAIEIVVP